MEIDGDKGIVLTEWRGTLWDIVVRYLLDELYRFPMNLVVSWRTSLERVIADLETKSDQDFTLSA